MDVNVSCAVWRQLFNLRLNIDMLVNFFFYSNDNYFNKMKNSTRKGSDACTWNNNFYFLIEMTSYANYFVEHENEKEASLPVEQ